MLRIEVSPLMKREASRGSLIVRRALSRPETFNEEAGTIEAVVATSTPVERRDQDGTFLEILDPAGANLDAFRGAAVLDSHRQDGLGRVLGAVEDARVEGGTIIARIRLSRRPDAASFVEDIRAGVIRHLSVGYTVERWRTGRDAAGNRTRTAADWTPKEVSFVAIPADPNCRVRSAEDDPASDRQTINRQIRDLARRARVEASVADALIDREATLDEARSEVLDAVLTRGQTTVRSAHHNGATLDNPEVFQRALGEALFGRTDPSHELSGPARAFANMRVAELARECLRRSGETVNGLSDATLITRALGGMHTTSDFPLALGDAVGRTLRQAYQAAPSGIRALGRQVSAPDFRMRSRIQHDATGLSLEKVNEHGEFKAGTVAEAAESYKVDTFGRLLGITRQALINDDLSAFDFARQLGQTAAGFEAQFLVNLLLSGAGLGPTMSDAKALFHADHGNLAASGGALAEATLSAARLAMRKQTGLQGGLISVTPRFLLLPPELETTAEKLLSAIQATRTDDVNPFASTLTPVVEPRLSSATRWYVTASPAEIDGLEFAYLAGAPGPQIETRMGFEVDGVQVRVRLDFGAGFVDWRGWHANAGA